MPELFLLIGLVYWHSFLTQSPGALTKVSQPESTAPFRREIAVCLALLHAPLVHPWPVKDAVLRQLLWGHLGAAGFTSFAVAVTVPAKATGLTNEDASPRDSAIAMGKENRRICMMGSPLLLRHSGSPAFRTNGPR